MDAAAQLSLDAAAALDPTAATTQLQSSSLGLSTAEATERIERFGRNVISSRRVHWWAILFRQLRNPVLWILGVAVVASTLLGDHGNSITLAVIIALSVGLSFIVEFRAEQAASALHSRVSHTATVLRDGRPVDVPLETVVPGDIVRVRMGGIVPADLRLLSVDNLECDESIVSGESQAVPKSIAAGSAADNCALMGTIVRSGSGEGVVVATGARTEFGRIALELGRGEPETYFQIGLRRFSVFLLVVAIILTVAVVLGNVLLGRPFFAALLFALALAVGMTPQLLPAILSSSLAMGARALANQGVLVKRLICIEDLGDINVLVTDKTGTLTTGVISYSTAVPLGADDPFAFGLLVTDVDYDDAAASTAGLTALDAALWSAPGAPAAIRKLGSVRKLASVPFDHERRLASVLVRIDEANHIVVKGSPEDLFAHCTSGVDDAARDALNALYEQGARVVAVAKKATTASTLSAADETDLQLLGFLSFTDPIKPDVQTSLAALAQLGIEVKIATGDSAVVAASLCRELGMDSGAPLTGQDISGMTDAELADAVEKTQIFARVSPEQKSRILKSLQRDGRAVGFLGDGVNDAIALHDADVGVSVDSGTDVAKDAADVVLLQKDLGVLANGIRSGRRVFNNTIKYLLMGTSGDFGNMFSAAIGSVVLPFLPMLPGQVLLQDLMYDSSQLAIPSDRVDPEQVVRPSHWDIGLIRRFMLVFGPISSVFDLLTFALMLWGFHASDAEFHTGWFVESLATATLIVLVIRTRRVPFLRSRPSLGLLGSVFGIVAIGAWLPYSPLAGWLGFTPLPLPFFAALAGMILAYLVLVEVAKWLFFRRAGSFVSTMHRGHVHRVGRRSARFRGRTGARPTGRGGRQPGHRRTAASTRSSGATPTRA